MRCEICGETLIHENEQIDGVCRPCGAKITRRVRRVRRALAGGKIQVPEAKRSS